ncbi:MAG: FecR family protein [Dehalococcoidia bacterium]|nr:FecR family protein [Dehalococcoidia bacterium]
MERGREVLAWGIVWTAFGVFCLTLVGLFLGVRWYMATATDSLDAHLKVVRGTVLVQESRRLDWVAAADGQDLPEGIRIRTDDTSQALITLFEGTTVNLFPGSEVNVTNLRRLRFQPNSIGLVLTYAKGKVRMDVGNGATYKRDFKVLFPEAGVTASLLEGSYSIDTDGPTTEIKVRDGGRALVKASDKEVDVRTGQRTLLGRGQPPTPPAAAAREMAINGRFQDGLARWTSGNRDVAPKSPLGSVTLIATELGNSVRFYRSDSNAAHAETYLRQEINQDVSDFRTLRLSLQLKLVNQSLSGGGYMGSEYPLLVRVLYRAERGDTSIVYAFFYQNEADNLTINGTQLPQGEWVSYPVPENLMSIDPSPVRILAVEVTASGHDYESLLKEISLEGE